MQADSHVVSWINHNYRLWAKRYEWAVDKAGLEKQQKALEEFSYFTRRKMQITQQYLDLFNKI